MSRDVAYIAVSAAKYVEFQYFPAFLVAEERDKMFVTIIIVNWNSGALLKECLRHLDMQTFRPAKIIVVDNASTDNSESAALDFSNVVLHRMTKNTGFAAGNNFAFTIADTEFVALLNPDAFPQPDWLERLVAAANKFPDVAAFGSRQLCSKNSAILDGLGDAYHISGLVWRARHGQRQRVKDLVQKEIFSPCAAAALYRRQAVIELGGFDEDYFCYVEDVDLGFRLRLAGYKSMYVPDAVVYHVGSATTGGRHSDFSIYHGHRNLVWTFVKNMPGMLFWLLLPFHLLINVVALSVFSFRGKGSVIYRAKRDAVRGVPQAWGKRKLVQARRIATIGEIWRLLNKGIVPGWRGD